MDSITDMALFARVVTAGGLSAAARELGLSPAVVSKRLARLEDRLGARLLHRTTRHISLTDEGTGFFERAQRILAEVEEAEAAVSHADVEQRGTLRVTVPASFGRLHVAPALPEFLARYPRLRLVVTFTDGVVDIVEGGYDLAVRVAELKDSSLIARRLAPNRRVICAAPAYLERHGAPATPDDLARHNCLIHTAIGPWTLLGPDGGHHTVRVAGNLETNDAEVLRDAAAAGLGIALTSTWHAGPHIRSGALVPVLTGYTIAAGVAIYAVYPSTRHLSAKVRALVDFLAARFGPEPYWDRDCGACAVVPSSPSAPPRTREGAGEPHAPAGRMNNTRGM